MRVIVAAASAALMLSGLSRAGNAEAAIREPTHIPPEALDRALQTLAKERSLVLAYRSEVVGHTRTAGASGNLTREEALSRLLQGTGLTYRFLDNKTVTIVPLAAPGPGARAIHLPSGPSAVSSSEIGKKAASKKSASHRFRASRLDPPQAAGDSSATAGADETGSPGELEAVVVTAEMRRQPLLDVPASITVISGNEIARTGAATIEDLQYQVPGMSISEFSPGQQRIEINGISDYEGLPTVGVYLDEMPLNMNFAGSGMDVRLLDMRRVEVLRGPQGTLYGQGSLGGTIRYITNPPDLNAVGGAFGAQGASIDGGGIDWQSDGVLNVPLVRNRLGVRLAADYQSFGGWIDETMLRIPRANNGKDYTVRATGLWRPSEPLSISLMLQHQVFQVNDQNLAAANGTAQDAILQPDRERVDLANLTTKYDLGRAQLLSSTGWLDRSERTQDDDSASYIPYLEAAPPAGLGLPAGSIQSVAYDFTTQDHILTEEVRLSTRGRSRLGGTVGVFYRDSQTRSQQSEPVTPDIVPVVVYSGDGTNPENSSSWAVFGQGYYRLTRTLEATLGLRYFQDRQRQAVTSTSFGFTAYDQGTQTFTSTSPRLDLSWHVTRDLNLYTSLAKGFRSGGFNLTSESGGLFPIPQTYAPETLWTYELGAKFHSDDGRVASEVSVYHNDWKNVQSLAFPNGFPLVYTVNGGRITGWGMNAQLTVRPIEALTLGVTGGWNDMAYVSTTADHLPGDPPDYVPPYTASAFAEYRYHWTPSLPGFLRVDYQRSDRFQIYLRNYMGAPTYSDVLTYLNVHAGIKVSGWTVSLLAKNLTNEDGVLYPPLGGVVNGVRPEPRTIGASVATTF